MSSEIKESVASAKDSYATNKTFAELGVAPELVAALKPNEVPLEQRTPEKVKALASTGLVALSGDDSKSVADSVCKQLNIKREDFDKA